jgi:polyisoprenoid-binding protein YceI
MNLFRRQPIQIEEHIMRGKLRNLLVAAALVSPFLLIDSPVSAQAPAAPPARAARPAFTPASHDPAAAPAGGYKMDVGHTSIIFRITHEGTSYSTFRFNSSTGLLAWNPARVEDSKVDISVDTKSIATPVANFSDRLTGENYLNSAAFPVARFVSTSIRRTGPTTGVITGNLTLLGQTKPITVNAELVGIGSNPRGQQTIGFTGTTKFKRSDFGLTTLLPAVGDQIELTIDAEFNHQV